MSFVLYCRCGCRLFQKLVPVPDCCPRVFLPDAFFASVVGVELFPRCYAAAGASIEPFTTLVSKCLYQIAEKTFVLQNDLEGNRDG